ncbi:hypothetical protein [Streptomyces sp. Ru73]|uniref:hypothetical protein n=1 Tax=Streptomyces sp. Ru73 TaxID=2080748 RepID=UPI0015E2D676|nr:hypothetical protein [Streptomyces sp. Ru73]
MTWSAVVVTVAAAWTAAGIVNRPSPPDTRLYGVAPWAARGPADSIDVVGTARGSCPMPSRVTGRPDAYLCITAEGTADPCFAPPVHSEPTSGRVLCPAGGSVTRYRAVAVDGGLVTHPAGPRREFAVRLADGQTCWATAALPGTPRYRCPKGTLQGPPHGPRTHRTAAYLPAARSTAQNVRVTITYR